MTPPKPLDARTSNAMRRVRTRRTGAEEIVARALRAQRVRYRRNVKTLPGAPDFANRRRGWAVLVHGCFWHGHDCRRGTRPRHNAEFWNAKIDGNRKRDERTLAELARIGLRVMTVWECELKDRDGLKQRLWRFFAEAEPPGSTARAPCTPE